MARSTPPEYLRRPRRRPQSHKTRSRGMRRMANPHRARVKCPTSGRPDRLSRQRFATKYVQVVPVKAGPAGQFRRRCPQIHQRTPVDCGSRRRADGVDLRQARNVRESRGVFSKASPHWFRCGLHQPTIWPLLRVSRSPTVGPRSAAATAVQAASPSGAAGPIRTDTC